MQYQEFVNRVNECVRSGHPGEPSAEAEYAIQATLATLGEHLSGAQAEELGARLPAELEAQLASGNYAAAAKGFSPAQFHLRVVKRVLLPQAEDSGHAQDTDQGTAQAVLTVLSEAVAEMGGAEFTDVQRQLSFQGSTSLPNA